MPARGHPIFAAELVRVDDRGHGRPVLLRDLRKRFSTTNSVLHESGSRNVSFRLGNGSQSRQGPFLGAGRNVDRESLLVWRSAAAQKRRIELGQRFFRDSAAPTKRLEIDAEVYFDDLGCVRQLRSYGESVFFGILGEVHRRVELGNVVSRFARQAKAPEIPG